MSANSGFVSTVTVSPGLRVAQSEASVSSSSFNANSSQSNSAAMMMAVASVLQQLGRARGGSDSGHDQQGMHTKQGVTSSDESLRSEDNDAKVQDDSQIVKAGV